MIENYLSVLAGALTGFVLGIAAYYLVVPHKPTTPPHQRIIIQGSHDNIVWFTIDSLLIPQP